MKSAAADQKRVSEVTHTLSDALVTAIWSGQSFQITDAQGEAARVFYSMVVNNDSKSAAEKREIVSTKLLARTLSELIKKETEQMAKEEPSLPLDPSSGSTTSSSGKRLSSTAQTLSAVSEKPWTLKYRCTVGTAYLAGEGIDEDGEDDEDFEEEQTEREMDTEEELVTADSEDAKETPIDGHSTISSRIDASTRTDDAGESKAEASGLLGDSYDSSVDALIVSKTEDRLIVMSDSTVDKSATIKSIASDTSSDFEKIEVPTTPAGTASADVDSSDTPVKDDCKLTVPETKRQKRRNTLKGESVSSIRGLSSELILKSVSMVSVTLNPECTVDYLSDMKQVESTLVSNALLPVSMDHRQSKSVSLVSVGRAEENDIITDPVFSGVSRFHGYLMRTDSSLLWVDLWSRFGSSLTYRSDSTQSLFASEAKSRHIIVLGKDETALIRLADECDLLINPEGCEICRRSGEDTSITATESGSG